MPKSIAGLDAVMAQNDLITYAYSRYLNRTPRLISADMVENLARDCQIPIHDAFLSLFAAACGLEPDTTPSHRALERNYLRAGVHRLDPAVYERDPYYQTVVFPDERLGKWEMCHHSYLPYEPFVCNHPTLTTDFREIPQIGYFDREFRFPAILENGVEWMTVTPNEIETMREPIEKSRGSVLTLGLGLGYFAFRAAQKEEVERVTVVERDHDVIALFQSHILPQFPNAHKIGIVEADAFAFMENAKAVAKYDYIFADLWHDQSDGLELYLRLRRIERAHGIAPRNGFDYWIEPTLLSALRHIVYEKLTDPASPLALRGINPAVLLTDEFLRSLR